MKPAGRSRRALLSATPPTLMSAVVVSLITAGHIVKGGQSIAVTVAVGVGLIAIVFLAYFGLALAGYRVKPDGAVEVPTRYAWLLVSGVTIVVMAAAFYLAAKFSR